MSIEICIINPYATAISNEKIKLCAQKILNKNSSIFISDKSFQGDYYDLHSETINVSKLLNEVETNNSSDAFIVISFEDIGVDTIRKITSKPIIGLGEAVFYTANIIANKFSIITNLSQSHEALKNNLIKYELSIYFIALIIVLSFFGDTLVSILKRYASIKDTGNIMPGHGGLLDRFDSFIAVFFVIGTLNLIKWKKLIL